MTGPFDVLGLPAIQDVTDDDVRAAWRRVAAATHPDRADGGDPAGFAAAAEAYTRLRTPAARAEALAAIGERAGSVAAQRPVPGLLRRLPGHAALIAERIARGRPLFLTLRVLAAAAAGTVAVAAVGWQPASAAVITGALTWLVRTGRADLAPSRPDSS